MGRFLFRSLLLAFAFTMSQGDNVLKDYPIDKRHHIHGALVKTLLQQQVSHEINASLVYMAMAAHFGSETVNRLGFTKFFKECSEEEFQHAQKFIAYMNKRGVHLEKHSFHMKGPQKLKWNNGLEALEDALTLEGDVTKLIKQLHKEAGEDGHLTNFLEEEFLEEQVNSMRQLSGFVTSLRNMARTQDSYDHLAEYLFDMQLQNKKIEL